MKITNVFVLSSQNYKKICEIQIKFVFFAKIKKRIDENII